MIDKLHSLAVIAAHAISMYGWGAYLTAKLHGNVKGRRAYATTLGLAVWIALGGVLCLLRMATMWPLIAILVTGLGMAAYSVAVERQAVPHTRDPRAGANEIAEFAVGLTLVVFLVLTLAPALVFNNGDDFQCYLMRPVHILSTGTVTGDPFDIVGLDGMGAQSFLHAMFLIWLPFTHLNALDAILCFSLATCLLLELGRWLRTPWPLRALAALLFAAIDPLYVNVASLYSASLMIVGAVAASTLVSQSLKARDDRRALLGAGAIGLLLGSLIPLKSTLGPFMVSFAVLYPAIVAIATGKKAYAVRLAPVLWGVSALAVSVWAAGSLSEYIGLLHGGASPSGTYATHATPSNMLVSDITGGFFSLRRTDFGAWYCQYGAIMLLLLLTSALGFRCLTGGSESDRYRVIPLAAVCLSATLGTSVVFVMVDYSLSTPVRYSCPQLIAGIASSIVLVPFSQATRTQGPPRLGNGWQALATTIVVLNVLLLASFSVPLAARVRRILGMHTEIPFKFALSDVLRAREMIGVQGSQRAELLQGLLEPGAGVLLRVGAPFQYDFSRNRVSCANAAGLASPLLRLPVGASPDSLRRFMLTKRIRYVIWEYRGPFAVRYPELQTFVMCGGETLGRIGIAGLYFYKTLGVIAGTSKILYDDDTTVVFDMTRPRQSTESAGSASSGSAAEAVPGASVNTAEHRAGPPAAHVLPVLKGSSGTQSANVQQRQK